jgi:hypothetical protein
VVAAVDVAVPGGQSASTLATHGGATELDVGGSGARLLPEFSEVPSLVPSEVPSPRCMLPAVTKRCARLPAPPPPPQSTHARAALSRRAVPQHAQDLVDRQPLDRHLIGLHPRVFVDSVAHRVAEYA